MKADVSYLIVVRHDPDNLKKRLQEIAPYVRQIVVVHDGDCHDNTLEVAADYGADIVTVPFRGYCEPNRQLGLAYCMSNWVLVGDADEEFDVDFLRSLHDWVCHATDCGLFGYWLTRDEIALNHQTGQHLRFFRRVGSHFSDVIHTHVTVAGPVSSVPGISIYHHSLTDGKSADPELVRDKNRRYNSAQEQLRLKYKDMPDVLKHLNVEYDV